MISVLINILQGTRILRLEEALEAHPEGTPLAEGEAVPELDLRDESDRPVLVRFADFSQPTLVYVFSPSCSWCERNLPSFKALVQRTKARVRIVGLSLAGDGVRPFLDKSGMAQPAYLPSPATMRSYRLSGTPTTIVVSPSGVVLKIWSGAYIGRTKREIESYFGIALPPLESGGQNGG